MGSELEKEKYIDYKLEQMSFYHNVLSQMIWGGFFGIFLFYQGIFYLSNNPSKNTQTFVALSAVALILWCFITFKADRNLQNTEEELGEEFGEPYSDKF